MGFYQDRIVTLLTPLTDDFLKGSIPLVVEVEKVDHIATLLDLKVSIDAEL